MRGLTAWTAGLAGPRDPAQPLLTHYDGAARVELSGATTANWVAKSANLLVDGLGGPQRVGLALPLHWQTVCLLLAGVASGATVVVAADAADLAGCGAAFVTGDKVPRALDAGVDEVLALSVHPLGAPLGSVPTGSTDFAREVPSYADHWGGSAPARWSVEVGGALLDALPALGLTPADRVLVRVDPAERSGLVGLLAVLAAGASLVLAVGELDAAPLVGSERLTASLGVDVAGLRRL